MTARDQIVVHYHEIGLKGRNRSLFERALVQNMVRATADLCRLEPRRLPGRIIVPVPDRADPGELLERLSTVYGIANLAHARGGKLDFDEICAVAGELVSTRPFESFAVRARTAHSAFPMTAREINEKLGAWLLERTGARVNLSAPDLTCSVEVIGELVLISVARVEGPGGLPVGVSGRVAVLISAGIDSPVASARMMRRGARCSFIHFHSQPFTDGSSERNTRELVQRLTRLQYEARLWIVPLAPAQQAIAASCPEDLRTILYRRMMMRIASEIARSDGAKALVTGDSLGQVASQTLENLAAVEDAASLPVLRPLIGLDKNEIIAESKGLGLFEISSAPCQEACVLFEPRNPVTKARLIDLERAETRIDVAALAEQAVSGAAADPFAWPPHLSGETAPSETSPHEG